MKKWIILLLSICIMTLGIYHGINKLIRFDDVYDELKVLNNNMSFRSYDTLEKTKIEVTMDVEVFFSLYTDIAEGDASFAIVNENGENIINEKGANIEFNEPIILERGTYEFIVDIESTKNGVVKSDVAYIKPLK